MRIPTVVPFVLAGLALTTPAHADYWSNIKRVCQGKTQFVSAQLMDIQGSWEEACARKRGPDGLDVPQKCVNNLAMWGEWWIPNSPECGYEPPRDEAAPAPEDRESRGSSSRRVAAPKPSGGLPYASDVPVGRRLGLDGVWHYSHMDKRVRIEGSRYYAVDPWVHGLFLPVEQDMVIAQDIRQTGPGRFVGVDLPTQGKARYKLVASGNIAVEIPQLFGPIVFELIPEELDDPAGYADLMREAGFQAPKGLARRGGGRADDDYRGYAKGRDDSDPPSKGDCQRTEYIPATGETRCLD